MFKLWTLFISIMIKVAGLNYTLLPSEGSSPQHLLITPDREACLTSLTIGGSELLLQSGCTRSQCSIVVNRTGAKVPTISNQVHLILVICAPGKEYSFVYEDRKKSNFEGATLHTVSSANEFVDGVVNEDGILTGFKAAESTIRDMQYLYNFKVTLRVLTQSEANHTIPGYFERGVGNLLDTGQADIAIGYFLNTPKRVKLWTASIPLMTEIGYAHFATPSIKWSNDILFLNPFSLNVFIVYIGLVSILSIIHGCHGIGVLEKVYTTISTVLTRQSMRQSATSFTSKWALMVACLLSVVIHTVYNAQLLRVLRNPDQFIKRLMDLTNLGYKFFGAESVTDLTFGKDKNLWLKEIGNEEDAFRRLFMEKLSFLGLELNSINGNAGTVLRHIFSNVENPDAEICSRMSSIRVVKSNALFASCFFLPRNSRLKEVVNAHIVRTREIGLMTRYLKYTSIQPIECPKPDDFVEDLNLSDVAWVFLLYAVVSLISACVCLWEVTLFRMIWFESGMFSR